MFFFGTQCICIKCRGIRGDNRPSFAKMFHSGKTGMIGLPYAEESIDDMLIRIESIRHRNVTGQTDGRTDRQTDAQNCYISIARQHRCADAR